MPPTRLTTTPSIVNSPFMTSSTPYSAFRLDRATSSTRPRSASRSESNISSSPPPGHAQVQVRPHPAEKIRPTRPTGHRTTPSGASFALPSSNLASGLDNKKTPRRIRSKKLQAKLANNALCHGFEENVAACILIELSRSVPVTPLAKTSQAGSDAGDK